jgi:hypothetical protein
VYRYAAKSLMRWTFTVTLPLLNVGSVRDATPPEPAPRSLPAEAVRARPLFAPLTGDYTTIDIAG